MKELFGFLLFILSIVTICLSLLALVCFALHLACHIL